MKKHKENDDTIKTSLSLVRSDLAKSLALAGRKTSDCILVAVSKNRTVDEIKEAIAAGQRVFGENRVQEAVEKWPDVKSKHSDVKLHLIGPLQNNKARQAVKLFDVIEVLDSKKLATTLKRVMEEEQVFPKIYIQVNAGEEEQKSGVLPKDLDAFIKTVCEGIGINIAGLMCIPPQNEEPAMHFLLLNNLAEKYGLKECSMGMSDDFDVAARLGATSVRVGTKIFGARG